MTRTLFALAVLALPLAAAAQGKPPPSEKSDVPRAEAPASAAEGTPAIVAIRVEGNRRVEADAVRNALRTKVGMPLDAIRAQEDLRAVYKLGFFSDVEILADDSVPQKPVLVVKVQEKPAIHEIRIRGNKELSDDDLKDVVDIKPFSILDIAAVQRNAKKLQDKYLEKGYFLAEVTHKVDPLENNEANVYLEVNEHAKVQVKRITFVGNDKVSDGDLRESMQTDEGSFLSFLTSAGTFREEVFKRDLQAIQGVYYDRGFIHVKVANPQISLSADKRLIFISIPITEGEQYSVGKIDFAGDLLVQKDQALEARKRELRQRMQTRPGELFNRTKLQRDIMALADFYYDAGYAYANISPQTTIDADRKTVDLTFDAQKGEKVTIERIEIAGNTKTRDKVIRRELRVFEGELFSGTGLRLSRQRVTALGFFESVDVTHKRGSSDKTVVVTVTVKEKATGTFQVGLGFSSIESFLLTAQVSQNNLFGWGPTASLSLQLSSLRSLVQLSYVDPYFLDTNWILSFDYFRQELDYFGFIRRSNGGDLSFGYHLTPDLMVHAGYAIELVDVLPGRTLGSEVLLANRFRSGLTSALRLTMNYDRRDNRLFPTAGNYQSLSIEYSPEWLGASFLFTRYLANSRWYVPLPLGLVFKAQGNLGYIAGSNIPISELFFAGGINTLRGYVLRSVAPTVRVGNERAPDAALSDFAIGGNKQLLFNFELEFPIFEKVGIRGVVFYDAGNVFSDSENFFQSHPTGVSLPLGLFHSFGFGFRWFSPIGPLRFEWGIPLTRRPTDDSVLFEFTIGNFF
jgi:outer membrane protein insertion porin family